MGGGPTIRRIDDSTVPWQRVKAQRNADGTESSVRRIPASPAVVPQFDQAVLLLLAASGATLVVRAITG